MSGLSRDGAATVGAMQAISPTVEVTPSAPTE